MSCKMDKSSSGRYIQIEQEFLRLVIRDLYLATGATDIHSLITHASVIEDDNVKESLFCLKKFIELALSGYVKPPLDLEGLLQAVIKDCEGGKV